MMHQRSLIMAFSLVVAVASVFSIASRPATATRTPVVETKAIARPVPPAARPQRVVGRAKPAARPAAAPAAGLPPATRMTSPSQQATPAATTLKRMVGQQVMARMTGTAPDEDLLMRIRNGEVGGVILYGDNVASVAQVTSLIDRLQSAAAQGGNPPLLIATDQEGGEVRRLPWAAPDLSAEAMGVAGPQTAFKEGLATAQALHAVGINVDLAPDADVAHSSQSFIWQQQRSFGMDSAAVRLDAIGFAEGLEAGRVAAAAKHFPGLGGAATDTDYALERLDSVPGDVVPFAGLISNGVPLVMVSTGIYPNLDPSAPAALSGTVINGILRGQLGYRGVVMTDDLERPTGQSTAQAVVQADAAGADIVLVSTTEGAGAIAYDALLQGALAGAIPRAHIIDAYERIWALKQAYAEGGP